MDGISSRVWRLKSLELWCPREGRCIPTPEVIENPPTFSSVSTPPHSLHSPEPQTEWCSPILVRSSLPDLVQGFKWSSHLEKKLKTHPESTLGDTYNPVKGMQNFPLLGFCAVCFKSEWKPESSLGFQPNLGFQSSFGFRSSVWPFWWSWFGLFAFVFRWGFRHLEGFLCSPRCPGSSHPADAKLVFGHSCSVSSYACPVPLGPGRLSVRSSARSREPPAPGRAQPCSTGLVPTTLSPWKVQFPSGKWLVPARWMGVSNPFPPIKWWERTFLGYFAIYIIKIKRALKGMVFNLRISSQLVWLLHIKD